MKTALILLLALSPAFAAPKKKAAAPKNDLKALLLSSPWCYFAYNQISGTTKTSRVVFFKNGTWALNGRHESYSSGAYGSVAGQTDSEDGGKWAVKGTSLLMSSSDTPELTDVGLTVSANSNGYPILKADGKEYSQCR